MANGHISDNCRHVFDDPDTNLFTPNGSQRPDTKVFTPNNGSPGPDSKVFALNGCPRPEDQPLLLWSRPVARTWPGMLLLGTCLLYCARMALPVCMVSMAATFRWSKTESGLVLGGFFWGYCFTQILGGHVSDRLGGERVLFLSTVAWASITAATPLLTHLGSHSLAAMTMARFLMGLFQGVYYPSLASVCSQRVTKGERGFLMSTLNSGCYLGTMLMGGLGSVMLHWYGWESVFYGTGLLSAVWAFVVWQFLLEGQVLPMQQMKQMLSSPASSCTLSRPSWLGLLKHPSVCAMVFTHMCYSSTSYTLLSWLPTYFKDTFPHAMGWVFNVVPWLVAVPSALIAGWLSDSLISQGFSIVAVRKTMQMLCMGVSSIFILLLCNPLSFPSALALVSAAMGCATFTSGGVSVNVQDIAPSHAGALFGFMNMCGAFMGLLSVSLSGYVNEVTLSWVNVFSIIVLVNVTGLGVFLVFGDARRVDTDQQDQQDTATTHTSEQC